ncbi:hypothetical protein [Roseinatronobacter monicus]|uniref:O-antigen/teichoic acid export membrane protein n=1 Tax=Roseinatronobacter monicus TaxID=393481 RepID=A0A543KIG2_9RHOB|nr:hypothetical protein [Roseinatronobacter monicus]TQM94875.1 hypothetical protein BD293_3565 [Roseinatronobacter monicus]
MRTSLLVIAQYSLIKVTPGVFNLALIPFLMTTLGVASYGVYSLWLGYAMLVGNVVGGVVAQPMYRHLPSRPDEKDKYHIFSLGAAGLAAVICLILLLNFGAPVRLAVGFSIFALGTVLAATVTVGFIIEKKVMRFAVFEALRIFIIVAVLAYPMLSNAALGLETIIFALALSNLVPLLVLAGRPRLVIPDRAWFRRSLSFGSKSAIWMLLAGLPIVGAKTILIDDMSPEAFGSYAGLADLTYRAFAMFNAVLMMWAFPKLSRHFDRDEIPAAQAVLWQTFTLYAAGGSVIGLGLLGAIWLDLLRIDTLPGAALAVMVVAAASFLWHAMSISHKVLEMRLMTVRMVWFMILGVAVFYALGFGALNLPGVDVFYAVNLTLIGIALSYIATCLRYGLKS